METTKSINLLTQMDRNLPEKTICVSSEIYRKYKDILLTKYICRNPVIYANSLIKIEDLNVIESSNLDDSVCLISNDIALLLGTDVFGDVLYVIPI